MLGKSSVLMMLLVGTGSLVGISSIYTPANVETQPIQQPQPQPQPQTPQSQFGVITPKSKSEIIQNDPNYQRALQDKQLLDRLMPEIVKRLQITLNFRDSYSPLVKISKDVMASESFHGVEARCPPGFRVTGGGGQISSNLNSPPSGLFDYKQDVADNNIAGLMIIPDKRLNMVAKMETKGTLMAYANCLGVEAIVKLKQ
jgi:hypothetical protein